MAAAAIFKITIIAIHPQRFDRSLRNLLTLMQNWPLNGSDRKKIKFQKSKMANSCHFENCCIILSLQPFGWF